MRESTLEGKIKSYAETRGCLFWKFVSPGTKGAPDRVLITPNGRTAFMEIKAPGQKAKPLQEYRLSQIREKGTPAVWVSSYECAVSFIDNLLTPKL